MPRSSYMKDLFEIFIKTEMIGGRKTSHYHFENTVLGTQ